MKGQPIHALSSIPVTETGFSDDPRKRLLQHRHYESSNYLMNLMDWDEWELSDGFHNRQESQKLANRHRQQFSAGGSPSDTRLQLARTIMLLMPSGDAQLQWYWKRR